VENVIDVEWAIHLIEGKSS